MNLQQSADKGLQSCVVVSFRWRAYGFVGLRLVEKSCLGLQAPMIAVTVNPSVERKTVSSNEKYQTI